MLWVVVDFDDRTGHLQWMLAALPAPIPTIPTTNRPVTTERPSTLMLWRSKQRRASSRISHFPLLAPSSQEAFKEEESVRLALS